MGGGSADTYYPCVSMIPLYGHTALRERLGGMAARGTLPHSILLHGPRGAGKQRLGLWLGSVLLCTASSAPTEGPCGSCQACRYTAALTHPDLQWFFPRPRLKDGDAAPEDVRDDYREAIADRLKAGGLYAAPTGSEGIFVATIRALVLAAAMSPALGRRKVFVVGDAERMVPQEGSEQAANALLKLLEEPPADTTLILTSSEPGSLLPTIRSRVVAFRVGTLPESDMRAFLADSTVQEALRKEGAPAALDDQLRTAAGAPGRLFGGAGWAGALANARRLLEVAARGERVDRMRVAFGQGASKARGSFSDSLEALTLLLHERVRTTAGRNDDTSAVAAARGIEAVERAKELARGNVSPQLVTAGLLREFTSLGL